MALSHSPRIATDGLVLYLDAANTKSYLGSGTTWSDLSGNGNNGTLVSNVGYFSDNKGFLTFDGNSTYVSLPDNITDLSGDWSISVWVKPVNDDNPRIMTLITSVDNLEVGYMNNTLVPYIRIDSSTVSSTTSLSTGIWSNIVYQVSNGNRRIYINSLLTSTVSGGIGADGMYSALGGGYDGFQFNGNLSIGAVYNRALSEAEIKQNFNAIRGRYGTELQINPQGIIQSGLVLNLDAGVSSSYPGNGTIWSDLSGNGNDFSLVNGVSYDSGNLGALSFDGTDDYATRNDDFCPNNLFADGNGSWTVSAWYKFPTTPIGTRTDNASWAIIGRAGGIATQGSFLLYVGSETDTTYGQYAPFKTAVTIRGAVTVMSGSVNTNEWNNIVLTWNGSSGSYYFNNTKGALNIGSADLQDYTDIYIGSNPNIPQNHYYSGEISNVTMYDRSLSDAEVEQNFNALRGRYGI